MKIKITLTLLCLFSLHCICNGQHIEEWSLEKCIKYAHENNLQIKQQEINVEKAENIVLQSKLNFIPTLNASINHGMNWGRSVNLQDLQIIKNHLSQSTSASLSSSINIIEGLQKFNTLKSNKTSLAISIQNVAYQKNQITIAIAKAYLQVLLSSRIKEAAQESYKSMQQQVEKTKKLVDAGNQAYGTLLEIEAQLATEKYQLIAAENDYRTNYLILKQLLDLGQEIDFTIIDPNVDNLITPFKEEDINTLYEKALDLPQIKAAKLALDKSKIDYKTEKSKIYPSVSFSAGYGTYYSDNSEAAFFRQFEENKNPSISFGLHIPIFNNYTTTTSIRNARLNIKNSEIELKTKHHDLYKEIQQAYNDALSSYEKLNAATQNMISLKESFSYVEKKFNVGSLSVTDYTISKANLFKSVSEYYQSAYQYIFQIKILDFYAGEPILL